MQLLSVQQLSKSFASKVLFEKISFGIESNQRVGLVGPNGAGKSTLLKILAGEAEADAGQITRKKGLQIGFLQQIPHFEPDDTILSAILSRSSDPDHAIAKAYQLMAISNLSSYGEDFQVAQLSGGWQKRVALLREMIAEPEILLLDEPTNHLDIQSILWLEDYLANCPLAILMVTHDRLFLQRVANRILDLDKRNPNYLLDIDGDYLRYVATKEAEIDALKTREQVWRNTLRRETEWLRRGAKARQTKQKARIQEAEALAENLSELQQKNRKQQVGIEFSENEISRKKLIELKNVSKQYDSRKLFENFSFLITPKTRAAFLGNNGCGKSTLLRIILGQEEPDSGEVFRSDKLQVAYFEQTRETLNPKLSVLRNICPEGDYVNFQNRFVHVRGYLERFLFSGVQVDLPVEKLSGGEQARLRIAQLMLQSAQVLVLDEPTNDLDVETLAVLENALQEFPGAVLLVTHDRYFMDTFADQIWAFPEVGESRELVSFADYFQWEAWQAEQAANSSKRANGKDSGAEKPAKSGRMSFKEKYELENIESEILKLEASRTAFENEMQLEENLKDGKKLSELNKKVGSLSSQIEAKYARWVELEAKK